MKVKVKFSQKFTNLKRRMKKLPVLFEKTADSICKKDARGFVNEYKSGLRNDNFGLKRLTSVSESQKIKAGYSKPGTPLYGAGDSEKNSYINALRIRKTKNGYRVYISWAKHHKSSLSLRALFEIHEKGCLIKVTEKMRGFLHYIGIHLKETTDIIRIPPRPTRAKAFKRWIAKRLINEDVKKSRKVIRQFLTSGNWEVFMKEPKNEITD